MSDLGTTQEAAPSDLGTQSFFKEIPRYEAVSILLNGSSQYTTNAALLHSHPGEDWLSFAEGGLLYQPKLPGPFKFDIGGRYALYRYEDNHFLSFDSLIAGAGISYTAKRLWDLTVFARYNFSYLIDREGDEIFHSHAAVFGVQKAFAISERQYCYLGASAQLNWSKPVAAERNEYGVYLGYHAESSRPKDHPVTFDFLYRAAYSDYRGSRHDWNQVINASLLWNFTKWTSIGPSVSLVLNNSNQDAFTYDAVTVGVGLSGVFRF